MRAKSTTKLARRVGLDHLARRSSGFRGRRSQHRAAWSAQYLGTEDAQSGRGRTSSSKINRYGRPWSTTRRHSRNFESAQPTAPGLTSGRKDQPSACSDLACVGGVGVHALGEHDVRKPDLAQLGERVLRSGTRDVANTSSHHPAPSSSAKVCGIAIDSVPDSAGTHLRAQASNRSAAGLGVTSLPEFPRSWRTVR